MKRTTKYVALDVHQATTVASVRKDSGRVIARSVLPTDGGAIVEFVRGMRGAVHVTFEEGTQAQWLHDLLAPLVDRVVVCDRRGAPRHGNKGDHVDADQLAELLRRGGLRAVYHGSAHRAGLKELTRTYQNLVEDSTRVMLRLKALFRRRRAVSGRRALRRARCPAAAAAQGQGRHGHRGAAGSGLAGAADHPVLGPVRVALLLATMQTPWRFRTKRNLWAYAGLAVVTRSSADYALVAGQPVRRRRAPMTRGLNRNHNRVLKDVFKGAATAATARPGPLQDVYHNVIARGTREELARLTLTRKLAALTLRLWKKGERYDPTKLTTAAR